MIWFKLWRFYKSHSNLFALSLIKNQNLSGDICTKHSCVSLTSNLFFCSELFHWIKLLYFRRSNFNDLISSFIHAAEEGKMWLHYQNKNCTHSSFVSIPFGPSTYNGPGNSKVLFHSFIQCMVYTWRVHGKEDEGTLFVEMMISLVLWSIIDIVKQWK